MGSYLSTTSAADDEAIDGCLTSTPKMLSAPMIVLLVASELWAPSGLDIDALELARTMAEGLQWCDEIVYRAPTVEAAIAKAQEDGTEVGTEGPRPPANVFLIFDPWLPTYDAEVARAREVWPRLAKKYVTLRHCRGFRVVYGPTSG